MNEHTDLITFHLVTLAARLAGSAHELTALRWQWLLSPSVERLQQLFVFTSADAPAPELKNTWLWFSFFDRSFSVLVDNHFSEEGVAFDDADAFIESLLVRVLIARRDGDQEMEKRLSDILGRMGMSAELTPESLAASLKLLFSVEQVIRQQNEPKADCEISVHSLHGEITIHAKKGKKTTISPALCALIDNLSRHANLTYEEALQGVFGIPRYDDTFHYAKIQNLLNRLRTLSQSFGVQTKDGRIYTRIDWARIRIIRASSHQIILQKRRTLSEFRQSEEKLGHESKSGRKVSVGRLRSSLGSAFTRSAFETAAELPRSTAARYLKRWISQQILTKEGGGRATIYRFKDQGEAEETTLVAALSKDDESSRSPRSAI